MLALGLDAASTSGWGIVEAGAGPPKLVTFGRIQAGDFKAVAEVVRLAVDLKVQVAVIESPYVDKNVDTALKLAMIVGRWAQELDRGGMPWELCKADIWQRGLLHGLITGRSPRADRKRAAQTWVKAVFHATGVSEDEADGICMAAWRAKLGRFGAPQRPRAIRSRAMAIARRRRAG